MLDFEGGVLRDLLEGVQQVYKGLGGKGTSKEIGVQAEIVANKGKLTETTVVGGGSAEMLTAQVRSQSVQLALKELDATL